MPKTQSGLQDGHASHFDDTEEPRGEQRATRLVANRGENAGPVVGIELCPVKLLHVRRLAIGREAARAGSHIKKNAIA